MPRTFIRPESQVRNSRIYDDTVVPGATMESGVTNIEEDLNCLRSQVKRMLDDAAGNWYDDLPTVNSKKRDIKDLNTDLDDLEIKPLLFHAQVLTDITVTAAQNWEILSVAGAETPSQTAAVGVVVTEGAVVAQNVGFGAHSLAEVAGVNAINPKNLCEIRDSTTGEAISSNGKQIFALIQCEDAVDGHTFDDVNHRVQLSFVEENAAGDDLIATPVASIAGKTINYSYVRRLHFDNIPEQAFLSGVFLDRTGGIADVTLNNAIDNQVGPATQVQSIEWRIADTFILDWQDSTGAVNLLRLAPNAAGDELEVNVDTLDFNHSTDADFSNGVKVDTAGTTINVGVSAGQIDAAAALTLASTGANNLTLNAGNEMVFVDTNKTGSTWGGSLLLSDTTTEWDNYETQFGEVSLLNAIVQASKQENRTKGVGVVTPATIAADTNVTGVGGGANLDAQLPDYSGATFMTDVDVYLNGTLLRNGADATANNDVYPGTTPADGDLKFEFVLMQNDVLTMTVWGE